MTMNFKKKLAALKKKAKPQPKKDMPPAFKRRARGGEPTMRNAKAGGKAVAKMLHEDATKIVSGGRGGGKTAAGKALIETLSAATMPTARAGRRVTDPGVVLPAETLHPPKPLIKPTLGNAITLVINAGICGARMFMAEMGVTYTEAVALVDALEHNHVIAPDEGLMYLGYTYRRVLKLKESL